MFDAALLEDHQKSLAWPGSPGGVASWFFVGKAVMSDYVIPPPAVPAVPVFGSTARFPVHRIYCVGRNYLGHTIEVGESSREAPFFFQKPADAVLPVDARSAEMAFPSMTSNLHHEVELVVAIGQGGRDIPAVQALAHVFGYAVGLDMTRRDLHEEMRQQRRPWSIAKGFDASAPIGPITAAEQVPDIMNAALRLDVNGKVRQSGNVNQMIRSVAEIIAHLSRGWALQPGDLIFTGTPPGVGPVEPGDVLTAWGEGLAPFTLHIRG
jgi:fumarylpyruvate hydrolase